MPEHNFSDLYKQFPAIIAQMEPIFNSHQFILELARQNQVLYIEALSAYRHRLRNSKPAPFLIVHGILAKHLSSYPHLIKKVHLGLPSKDIFGQDNLCSEWRKINK